MPNIKKFLKMLFALRSKKDAYQLLQKIYRKIRPFSWKQHSGKSLFKNHTFSRVLTTDIKFSFIYPYYDKKDTVLKSIESIKNQKIPGNIKTEIILIDDGSNDTDISKILPPDVFYLWRNKFGYGISRSRNLGAKVANGEYFVFLDPDLILSPSYIEAMVNHFHEYGTRTVLTGYLRDYHYMGCEDPRVAWGVWERPDTPSKRFLSIAGGNMAIHRDLFFEVGGFDEDLIYGDAEDILFGHLLGQLSGTTVVYSTGMTVYHIPHPPGLAHRDTSPSWDIISFKYPEFYKTYILEGYR